MRLAAYDFKFADTGAVEIAPVLKLTKDGVELKLKKEVVEYIQSDKIAPSKIFDLGFDGSIKAVVVESDLKYFAEILRANHTNGEDYETITLNQEVVEAEKKDVEFYVQKLGTTGEKYLITNLFVDAKMDAKFKVANAWYIPLEFMPSSTTQLTITNSWQ